MKELHDAILAELQRREDFLRTLPRTIRGMALPPLDAARHQVEWLYNSFEYWRSDNESRAEIILGQLELIARDLGVEPCGLPPEASDD